MSSTASAELTNGHYRAFIAIPLNQQNNDAIDQWLNRCEQSQEHTLRERLKQKQARISPPQNRHITLYFLGDINEQEGLQLQQRLTQLITGMKRCQLNFSQPQNFPRTTSKVVACICELTPELQCLWHQCRQALPPRLQQRQPQQQPQQQRQEPRPYRPHITPARLKKWSEPIQPPTHLLPLSMQVDEVVLFKSLLSPEGSRYTILQRYPLSKRPGQH